MRILYSVIFFRDLCVYEIISTNMVEPQRSWMTMWRRFAFWICKATDTQAHASARASTPTPTHTHAPIRTTHTHTHTQKYLRLTAFPRQKLLREHVSVLRCTYIVCLVKEL